MRSQRRGSVVGVVLRLSVAFALVAAIFPAGGSARLLYVTHEGVGSLYAEGGIVAMSIGADGKLTKGPVLGPEVVDGAGYAAVAMSTDGRHLFPAAYGASVLTGMTVKPDGSLNGDGNSELYAVFAPWGVSVSPDGRFAFGANGESASVSVLDLKTGIPDGLLSYPTGTKPRGVATTPDGVHVYVANQTSNNVSAYSASADGVLTHIADIPLPVGPPAAGGPNGVAISPDGRHLYVANEVSGNITGFSVEPSGLLLPIGTFPSTAGALANLAISPDGRHLFAAQGFGALVVAFNVAPDGSLTQVGAAVSTLGEPSNYHGMAVSPDGDYLYVTAVGASFAGSVAAFSIQSSGALVGVVGSPFPTGLKRPDYQSLAIAPDQSPVPSFTATPARKGTNVSFDGSASSDADGTVVRYDWDFGDGIALADGGPAPAHEYKEPGVYAAKLTVVDNEGCSTRLVYTGQTASCSGSVAATQSVRAGKLTLSLSGSRHQALSRKGIRLRVKCNAGACKVKASAKVKGLGLKSKVAKLSAPKAGSGKALKLKFSPKSFQRLQQALAAGGRLAVKVTATARAADLTAAAGRTVMLTG